MFLTEVDSENGGQYESERQLRIARKKYYPGRSEFALVSGTFLFIGKMVRLGRLERPTSCFGGTRSIQLSYNRTVPL